jgi:putative transposase
VFIKAESALKVFRTAKLCEVLNVKSSAYYAWNKRPNSKRSIREKELTELVREEFFTNHQIPGSRKITKKLSTPNNPVNRKTIAKIMRKNGWKSKVVKKYKATTNSKHNLPVCENILNRDFETDGPNKKWVCDITYVWTDEGWLYLAAVLDLYGREIVGWAMDKTMTKELVIRAFNQAQCRRGNPKEVLVHSDRGIQYCSKDYQRLLKTLSHICSMSRKGNCYDNAPMESFWGKLKQEWLNNRHFRTREDAKRAIFWYIEVYYRNFRLHKSNGYKTPQDYTKFQGIKN